MNKDEVCHGKKAGILFYELKILVTEKVCVLQRNKLFRSQSILNKEPNCLLLDLMKIHIYETILVACALASKFGAADSMFTCAIVFPKF